MSIWTKDFVPFRFKWIGYSLLLPLMGWELYLCVRAVFHPGPGGSSLGFCVPLALVAWSTGYLAFGFVRHLKLRRRLAVERERRVGNCCSECGYSLVGLFSHRCPECGTTIASPYVPLPSRPVENGIDEK